MERNQKLEQVLQKVQKPGRYVGGELNAVVKDPSQVDVRFAFCFPDTYEVGMSHLGIKILYGAFNEVPYFWCERVFAPWIDMEEQMRQENIPLYALESGDPVDQFDFIGFTLQYELSYTNVLNMLELAGIPLRSKDRTELFHIVVGGGPCVCNPEPLADFFDLFFLGDGEEVDLEVPYDPERIAILDMACLDIIDSLGVGDRVVGSAGTSLDYLQDYVTDQNIENLGTIKEADMEAVMACEPDVIFIGGRLSSSYDTLSEIAPVVYLSTDTEIGVVESVRKNASTIAAMFGLEDQVDELMADFDERIETLAAFAEGKTAIVGMCTSGSFNWKRSLL